MRSYINCLFAIFLLLPATSFAEEELKLQTFRCFAFQAPTFPAEIHLQTGKTAYTKVRLLGANSSKPLRVVNHSGVIRILGEPVNNAEGEPIYPVIGKVKSSPSWKSVFAVLNGTMEEDVPKYTAISFPFDNSFPSGSLKFANLSDRPIRGKMGKGLYKIPPRKIQTLKFKDPKKSLIDVMFQYQDPKNQSWYRMIATRWPVPSDGRRIMLAFKDPKSSAMKSKTIPIQVGK